MHSAIRWPLLGALALLGCSGPSGSSGTAVADPPSTVAPAPAPASTVDDPPKGAAQPEPPGPPAGHGADELHRLEGRSQAEILAELGEPTSKRTFTMKDCCNEFEIELLNTYPPNAGHDAVVIHEWTWQYDGYALTVWLHDEGRGWKVLETSRYADDVEF